MQDFPSPQTLAEIEANARKLRAEAIREMAGSVKGFVATLFVARPRSSAKAA